MGSFSADLTKFCDKYDASMKVVIRKIAFEAFSRIILKTPVDTGRARANWTVSPGSPTTVFKMEVADKEGFATLQAAKDGTTSWLCQGSLFMVNNLPYIGTLEYGLYPNPAKKGVKTSGGYSIQAPQGMVRITMEEMEAWIKSVIVS